MAAPASKFGGGKDFFFKGGQKVKIAIFMLKLSMLNLTHLKVFWGEAGGQENILGEVMLPCPPPPPVSPLFKSIS